MELPRCVPSKGKGAPFETAVTAGAEGSADEEPLSPTELIEPPEDLMLCQLPLSSP